MPTHDPGRTALRCPSCQATLAYLSTAAVKRASAMAGFGLFTPDHAVNSVANAGALRCYKCEAEAVNAAAAKPELVQHELGHVNRE